MAQSDFIPISNNDLNSFKNSIKEYYELEETPTIPSLPNGSNMNKHVDITTTELTTSFSGSLGIAGIINLCTSTDFEYHAMDIMKKTVVSGSPQGPILSATYGVGARILLKIKKIDAKADIKLSKLAAQTELGEVETSIALQLRGFGAGKLPEIPDDIFTFSEFDLEKYAKINDLINKVKNYLTTPENENSYDPVLIGVELSRRYADDIEDVFEWGNYALWQIAQKKSLKEAFKIAEEKKAKLSNEEKDIIRRTYALICQRPGLKLMGAESQDIGKSEPNNREKSKAKQLLVKFRHFTEKDI